MTSKYSIAVLPFVNMSSDRENEYFSDGITEEIITALSKIEGLHVTARTSAFAFKNQNIDIREIGRKLNVALLLEGSVRKSGKSVRITAQLTRAEDGYHEWSDSWDRELKEIFIVQDEIAAIIAGRINENTLPGIKPDGPVVANSEAVDWYLKGTYHMNQWDFKFRGDIIRSFEKSIELDPKLIKSYIGLCNAYTWLSSTGYIPYEESYLKIKENIENVMALDRNVPEVYMVLAGLSFWIEWDLPKALNNIDRSLALQPGSSDVLKYKGLILTAIGNVEEALDCLFQSERLDPYGDQTHSQIGMIYNWTNDNLKALEYIEKGIAICPHWYAQYLDYVEVLCKLGRFEDAVETISKLEDDPKSPLDVAYLRANMLARQGRKKESHKQIGMMKQDAQAGEAAEALDAAFYSQVYLLLGEYDRALDYLEYGMKNKSAPLLFIKIQNEWDVLRDHPRFIKALKAIGYPEVFVPRTSGQPKYKKSMLPEKMAMDIMNRLNQLMQTEKPWLNPTLNLSDLAESLDITYNQLSQVLNVTIGKNFYDYVNSYRLDYFLELHKDPKHKSFTLLSLAYESGFNSKTTFNNFFRKTAGRTPSEYFRLSNP